MTLCNSKETKFVLIEIKQKYINSMYVVKCVECKQSISISVSDEEEVAKLFSSASTSKKEVSHNYTFIFETVKKQLDILFRKGMTYVHVTWKCYICKKDFTLMAVKCLN